MPYTVRDTPEIIARIEADLATVARVTRAGDPALRALVLTGGFARGEGAVMDGDPQNDYDLVAVRGLGRPRVPYATMQQELEGRLGLHIDLAPLPAWRLRWLPPSIFWYETALRGRTLWGEEMVQRMPVRNSDAILPTEGLRLLVNRAAGLLLATGHHDAHAVRIQCAKALLAAFDARMLAHGTFAPSQTERWRLYQEGAIPRLAKDDQVWTEWAYCFKVDPQNAPRRDADAAWLAARRALLEAVPTALRHAGFASMQDYARHDGVLDRLVYRQRRSALKGAKPLRNPTGRVRLATLALLEAAEGRRVPTTAAQHVLADLVEPVDEPLVLLEGLRRSTLQ